MRTDIHRYSYVLRDLGLAWRMKLEIASGIPMNIRGNLCVSVAKILVLLFPALRSAQAIALAQRNRRRAIPLPVRTVASASTAPLRFISSAQNPDRRSVPFMTIKHQAFGRLASHATRTSRGR